MQTIDILLRFHYASLCIVNVIGDLNVLRGWVLVSLWLDWFKIWHCYLRWTAQWKVRVAMTSFKGRLRLRWELGRVLIEFYEQVVSAGQVEVEWNIRIRERSVEFRGLV